MTRKQFCTNTRISRWKLIKCVELIVNGYKFTEIRTRLKITMPSILKIERLFVKQDNTLNINFGHKSQPYYATEQEMEIQQYNAADLRGEELEILNSIK